MTIASNTPTLFTPIKIGNVTLQHRVAMAPLSRSRAPNHIPLESFATYYEQRASRAGTLIISEGTFVDARAGGFGAVPGIWNQDQINGWKNVISKIHNKGSFVFIQLWAIGRLAFTDELEKDGVTSGVVSASDVPTTKTGIKPRSISKEEIKEYVQLFSQAARNAIEAGADGVEIHTANGYLFDQFFRENTNLRTDEYGGSIANRSRFALEVVDAIINAIGAEKVAVRLSPWSKYGELDIGVSPIPQFSYIVSELEKRAQQGNRLAYVHMVEPGIDGPFDASEEILNASNEFARNIWQGIIVKAGHLIDKAVELAEEDDKSVIAIGRYFVSNPDLVNRLEKKIELTPYDTARFHGASPYDTAGYTDYEFASY